MTFYEREDIHPENLPAHLVSGAQRRLRPAAALLLIGLPVVAVALFLAVWVAPWVAEWLVELRA